MTQIIKRETQPEDAREMFLQAMFLQAMWLLYCRAPHKRESEDDGSFWLGEVGAEKSATNGIERWCPYSLGRVK